jgi:PAT family beta-lactamase induction signal transducer AmpG
LNAENPILRYFTFSVLYIAQGIPEGITFFAIPAWLAMNDKTPTEIASFIAVIGIPWSFKILIAPLMDRYTILSMGRKRPWVILGQLGLILSFLSIALIVDPVNNLKGLMISGFLISFFGAFQDVATDGMAIDVVPKAEQARANGLMWGSKVIGISASLLIGTTLINKIGFSTAIASISIMTAFIMLVPICFRERPGERLMPWTQGKASKASISAQLLNWKNIFKNLFKVIMLPSSILMCIAFLILGIMFGAVETLLPIFTIQELDWTNTIFSEIFSTTSILGGILGMLAGGILVDFYGKKRMLAIYLFLLIGLIISFAISPSLWSIAKIVIAFILIYTLLTTFLNIAIFATGMQLCWKTVAATQFTLFMTIANMGRSIGAWLLGVLKESMTWDYMFLIIALLPLVALFIIQFLNFEKHQKAVGKFRMTSTLKKPEAVMG